MHVLCANCFYTRFNILLLFCDFSFCSFMFSSRPLFSAPRRLCNPGPLLHHPRCWKFVFFSRGGRVYWLHPESGCARRGRYRSFGWGPPQAQRDQKCREKPERVEQLQQEVWHKYVRLIPFGGMLNFCGCWESRLGGGHVTTNVWPRGLLAVALLLCLCSVRKSDKSDGSIHA